MNKTDTLSETRAVLKSLIENLETALGVNPAFPITKDLADAISEIDKFREEPQ